MNAHAWETLRALLLAVTCLLGSGAVGGWVIAEWANMRDYQTGRNQPRPVWTAEEKWGRR